MAARTAVVAGTATAVSGRVARRQQAAYAAEQQAQQAPEAPAAAPPADAGADIDVAAQLQQFAALHAQGVLTDEEFAAKKAQILGI